MCVFDNEENDAHPSNNYRNVIYRNIGVKSLDFSFIFLIDEFSLVEVTNYINAVVIQLSLIHI